MPGMETTSSYQTKSDGHFTYVYVDGEYVAVVSKAGKGRWIVDTGTTRTERTTRKAAIEDGVWLASQGR